MKRYLDPKIEILMTSDNDVLTLSDLGNGSGLDWDVGAECNQVH